VFFYDEPHKEKALAYAVSILYKDMSEGGGSMVYEPVDDLPS
jgi:hypothetical protein